MRNKFGLIVGAIIFLISCRDIVEPDKSNKIVELLSPSDSLRTSLSSPTFWWSAVDGAEEYNIQVVKPSFANIHELILDSTVFGNKFSISFVPGNYQWRVIGINNGYSTLFQTRNLFIDSTGDINSQIVILVSPQDNKITNNTTILFQWNSIYNADEYRFKLLDSLSITILDTFLFQNMLNLILNEGEYVWQIRGENNSGTTAFTTRSFAVDLTAPSLPTSLIPMNNDTVSNLIINLSWNSDHTSILDSLYIYNDSLFVSVAYSGTSSTSTSTFNGLSAQHYYWRLKSVDAAGNWGNFTSLFSFYIQ